jgi:beta-glucanase (GH16 family)
MGAAALVVALGLGPAIAGIAPSAGATAGPSAVAALPDTPVLTSTLEDDFNGPKHAPPNSSLWMAKTGKGVFNHKNLATYTSSPDNVSVDGRGHLRITARRDSSSGTPTYTSGFLSSKELVGPTMHIEARVKMASGYGLWPNFWVMGVDADGYGWPATGEVDIAENPAKLPYELWATAHGLDVPGDDYTPQPLAAAYHVYGLDVTSNSLTWTYDGVAYKTFYRDQLQPGQEWSFDKPFVIIFNLAVGGPFPSNPKPSTKFPTTMKIDYVKVTPG